MPALNSQYHSRI